MKADGDTVRAALLDAENRYRHYAQILDDRGFAFIQADLIDFSNRGQLQSQIDVAICSQEFDPLTPLRILALKDAGISTCHVMDGVLEWKNLWENPRSFPENDGPPVYEPVLSDAVICMGNWQAELLKMLGTTGVCHPVGLPRLDVYKDFKEHRSRESPKILVSTATKLGFIPSHIEATTQGLRKFHETVSKQYPTDKVTWRVDEAVAATVGISTSQIQSPTIPLASVIDDYDILFSTPSTVLLEGMIAGLRVCQLNFTTSPHFIHTVWSIESQSMIADVIGSIVSPTDNHLRFQDMLRNHQVARPGDSTTALKKVFRALARKTLLPANEQHEQSQINMLTESEAELMRIQMQRLIKQHESSLCTRVRRLIQRILKRSS